MRMTTIVCNVLTLDVYLTFMIISLILKIGKKNSVLCLFF